MDALQAIKARYSFRGMYQDTPVPREDLKAIMEAGLAAPSGCNEQTTSLIGIDDPTLIKTLGDLLRKPHFASAPAAICVLTRPIVAYENRTFHIQDYAAAIENMLLATTALGYASCWVEGYVTGSDAVGKKMGAILRVPEGFEVVAYLPVGVPQKEGPRAKYKPFEARAAFNGFSETMNG